MQMEVPRSQALPLSPGEIHYVLWFIQGSIMNPDVRWRLRRAWGMCERHAWGALAVETAFRPTFLHSPSVLYDDIMERAVAAWQRATTLGRGRIAQRQLARRLRPSGPCLMCDMNIARDAVGAAGPHIIRAGANASSPLKFAGATRSHWLDTVCGRCVGQGGAQRCRRHLIEDISAGVAVDLAFHRELVDDIARRIGRYHRSFRWEYRDSDTEDRASLISAVGWCTGWRVLIELVRGSA